MNLLHRLFVRDPAYQAVYKAVGRRSDDTVNASEEERGRLKTLLSSPLWLRRTVKALRTDWDVDGTAKRLAIKTPDEAVTYLISWCDEHWAAVSWAIEDSA